MEAETVSFQAAYTGMPLITRHMDQSILKSQGESLLIAMAFIFILLAIKLRSIRGGILGLAPICPGHRRHVRLHGSRRVPPSTWRPCWWSIALGIGIDYVIHFSVRFTTYYRGPGSAAHAVKKTIQTTGTAIIINVLAVTMGFVTLVFANLCPCSSSDNTHRHRDARERPGRVHPPARADPHGPDGLCRRAEKKSKEAITT